MNLLRISGHVGSIIYAEQCRSIKIKLMTLIQNVAQQRSMRINPDQFYAD